MVVHSGIYYLKEKPEQLIFTLETNYRLPCNITILLQTWIIIHVSQEEIRLLSILTFTEFTEEGGKDII